MNKILVSLVAASVILTACDSKEEKKVSPPKAYLLDGIHLVTPERRGTWQAEGAPHCKWWITGGDHGQVVLARGSGTKGLHPHVITLGVTLKGYKVRGFRTEGCGTWTKTDVNAK